MPHSREHISPVGQGSDSPQSNESPKPKGPPSSKAAETSRFIERIQQLEETIHVMSDFTFDMEYWVGPNRRFLYVSPACEALTGYPAQAFLANENLLEHITLEEDRYLLRGHFQESPQPGTGCQLDLRIRTRSGDIRWISHRCRPLFSEDGRFLGRRGSNRDITERKQAQQNLHRSEEKYRGLFNSVKDGIVMIDMGGRILECNPAFREMLGYSREELRHRAYPSLIPQKWHEMHEYILREEIIARGHSDPYEQEYRRRDGSVFPVSLRGWLIRDAAERPAGMWAIVRDITERKQAELALQHAHDQLEMRVEQRTADLTRTVDALHGEIAARKAAEQAHRTSEARFRHIYDNAPVMMHSMDEQGIIRNVNNKWLEETGYTREEVIGQPAWFLMTEESAQRAQEVVFPEFLRKGVVRDVEYEYRRKDGSIMNVLLTCDMTVDPTGNRISLSVVRDITRQKETEQQLFSYQERLRSLASELSLTEERERKQLAADLHDSVGQTLAFTQIKLEALRKTLIESCPGRLAESSDSRRGVPPSSPGPMDSHTDPADATPDPAAAAKDATAKIIIDGIDEACDLVEQTNRDLHHLIFEISPPILYELGFEAAIEWLCEQVEQKYSLHCMAEETRGTPWELDADFRVTLFRAVRELLYNIVKHASATEASVAIETTDQEIHVRVRDNGVGMDPDKVMKTSSRKAGFGLFNIRERLNTLGGRLAITRPHAGGTCVTLVAPLQQGPEQATPGTLPEK